MVPKIALRLPRSLRSIHQIELSSLCNLRCVYCPHGSSSTLLGSSERPKQIMDELIFERALAWVRHFASTNPEQRRELNLAGLGESTLHPQFVDFVRRARAALGPEGKLVVTTNGLLVTADLAAACVPYNLRWYVSLHRPEKAGPAVEILRACGALEGVSNDPALAAVDWAGQVKWHTSASDDRACPWIREGQGYVFADGRISTCAFDASAKGVIGSVLDVPGERAIKMAPYELCKTCDQHVAVDGYDQFGEGRARRALPILS